MEMKKQVLSFSEFVNEAYNGYNKLMEGEGAEALIEAISKLESSGISKDALNELGIISGIAKAVATKESPDSEEALGNSILSFINGITETGVKITKVESNINVITYDNVVAESVLLTGGDRVKLLDWIYVLNGDNASNKSSSGAYVKRGKTFWNKVQTDKRMTGISGMDERIHWVKNGYGRGKDLGYLGKTLNFLAAMIPFKKETRAEVTDKDTKYLLNSGLLGQNVITAIESGSILTETSSIEVRDMFLGGKDKKNDRRGLSNISGNKETVNGFSIAIPLGAQLTEEQMDPTSNKAKKVGAEKAYFTLVLYSIGEIGKSTRQIPFSDIVLTEKTVPTGENVVTYTEDLLNNEDEKKRVLFTVDSSELTDAGKDNINNLIEQFYSIESIEIQGFASKEGDKDNNDKLCVQRAAAVATHIKSVKDWGIPAAKVTSSLTPNVQPKTSTDALPSWRKVRFVVKGTKAGTVPATQTVPVITPTIGQFTPDKVDIKQICLCFEVAKQTTTRRGK
jgi:outer membrane protein OmpA-like peptidoglycan-associated protein